METVTVYLGLGSNLGHREENLAATIHLLRAGPPSGGQTWESNLGFIQIGQTSSVYETSPWGYKDQPNFLNCVLEAHTNLPPDKLLERVKAVERIVGRQASVRYGPRIIDVDILLYNEDILDQPELQIPHPRLHQRAFALVPLAELHPNLVHPSLRMTIGELACQVDGQEWICLWGPPLNKTC